MTREALSFGPEAYFSLMVLGLAAAVVLAHGSFLKAVTMVTVGLLLGLVGTDTTTGDTRMTLGLLDLSDGIPFVCLAVGVFGIAEIVANLRDPDPRHIVDRKVRNLWITQEDFRRAWKPAARGTLLGGFFGALPGGGAVLSAFAAYSLEKKLSKNPSPFGKGAIEGVAAPEAANNAGAQASFIPLLTLGIPANAVIAVMIGAMQIQGIAPGPRIIETQSLVFWSLIASMWIGNLMLVIINLPLIGLWVRLLTVPYRLLFPSIIVFACIGVYSMNNNPVDVVLTVAFGAMGVVLRRYAFEPAPLILGFVLGPLMETNFRRAMLLSRGDPLDVPDRRSERGFSPRHRAGTPAHGRTRHPPHAQTAQRRLDDETGRREAMSKPPFEQNMTFLYSDELEESAAFFSDKLGLPLVLDQGVCRIFQVSPTGFLGVCNKKDRPRGTKGVMFTFLTDDLARDYKIWLERGVEFDGPPSLSGNGNVHSVFFRDYNGYMLELQEFRDPRWPYPEGRAPRTGPATV